MLVHTRSKVCLKGYDPGVWCQRQMMSQHVHVLFSVIIVIICVIIVCLWMSVMCVCFPGRHILVHLQPRPLITSSRSAGHVVSSTPPMRTCLGVNPPHTHTSVTGYKGVTTWLCVSWTFAPVYCPHAP